MWHVVALSCTERLEQGIVEPRISKGRRMRASASGNDRGLVYSRAMLEEESSCIPREPRIPFLESPKSCSCTKFQIIMLLGISGCQVVHISFNKSVGRQNQNWLFRGFRASAFRLPFSCLLLTYAIALLSYSLSRFSTRSNIY